MGIRQRANELVSSKETTVPDGGFLIPKETRTYPQRKILLTQNHAVVPTNWGKQFGNPVNRRFLRG